MSNLIRCFICIRFDDSVLKEITRIQQILGKQNFIGKLTEPENLHLTFKFLGEIRPEKMEEVRQVLAEIKFTPLKVKIGNSGLFHSHNQPRIAWIKIIGKQIYELQKEIDNKLSSLGFNREKRFMSHLTIARIKYVKDPKAFNFYVSHLKPSPISFTINEFLLMQSELNSQAPRYTCLQKYTSIQQDS